MKSIMVINLAGIFAVSLLTGCGIDSDSDTPSSNNSASSSNLQIAAEETPLTFTAAGIKGPLAFAESEIYEFDPSFPYFYDENSPISSAISSQFAEIDGLAIPRNIEPPYILTVGGSNAIDLNTGKTPVISTLITVITKDMLADNRPIYATPLTTLVFHMARHGAGISADADGFRQHLRDAASQVSHKFAIDQDKNIDVFRSPLIISDDTDMLSEQEEAVHHRAALEAFAAKVHKLSLSLENTSTDSLIERIAVDIQSDGVVDNLADGTTTGKIDLTIFSQDPMKLQIPNTTYRVEDITKIMEEERTLIMTDRGPTFMVEAIGFGNQPISPDPLESSSETSYPDPLESSSETNYPDPLESSSETSYPDPLESSSETSYSDSMGNLGNTLIVASGLLSPASNAADIMNIDFENRVPNTPYMYDHLIEDFNANKNDGAFYGPKSGHTRIVSDPAGTGRGNVLRVRHPAGEFAKGGVSFKARFAPDNENKSGSARFDDVYFAYDIYLSPNTERMPYHKMPGLITGTLLEASHHGGVRPVPEGIKSFTALMQSFTALAHQYRPDGALSLNYYDAEKTTRADFLDTVDPTQKSSRNSYAMPLGVWITVEQRVKLNTADSNDAYNSAKDLKDGLAEVWINGVKMSSKKHLWRHTNTMKADGFWFYDYYNDTSLTTPPNSEQYVYYDNFWVSTSPITH